MPEVKRHDAPEAKPASADKAEDTKPLTETVEGGVYEQNGVKVDANGELISKRKKTSDE